MILPSCDKIAYLYREHSGSPSINNSHIPSFASFSIDGKRNPDFYSSDELESGLSAYAGWEEIRPFVFQTLKGNKLPKSIKLVLSLPEEKLVHLPNTKAAFLNLTFRENEILCTTAIAQETFSLDKQGEAVWEDYILKFFKKYHIGIQVQ